MEAVDAVVIGAGVVGLAVTRALALQGHEVLVLERGDAIGSATSSRNSEVIHAGLYYPSGSLKARLCVAGREALYAYCESHGVAHRRCGKLLVATREAQRGRLAEIEAQARANGVTDLRPLDTAQARALEPELQAVAALLSPSTGIIDSHALMLSLLGDLEAAGGTLVLRSPVQAIDARGAQPVLQIGGEAPMELGARIVVNAAGLWAPGVASAIDGLGGAFVPAARYAKGSYFALSGRAPFSHLIYPMPEDAGLGVHLTLDLAGQARFGPDVEWIEQPDYQVDSARAERFYAAIRSWWPGLADGHLQPAYAGVRPKIVGPGEADADFRIDGPSAHGVPGLVHLYGIESPGLTAALAIGARVAAIC